MFEDIKDKVIDAVGNIDKDELKAKAADVAAEIKDKAADAVDFVKGLDVGNMVSEGKNLASKLDIDSVKSKIVNARPIDNGRADEKMSLLRSGKDFLLNYPRYYIEGLVGTIQDRFEKKK